MKAIKTFFFLFISIHLLHAQDGVKIQLDNTDKYHIHDNYNGDPMFEVNSINTFFGEYAGQSNNKTGSLGNYNTFYGNNSGRHNNDGSYNVFMGAFSGRYNTTGKSSTFIGYGTAQYNEEGSYNTCVGNQAGSWNTESSYNTCIGYKANLKNYGARNTALGAYAGYGGDNSYVGNDNVFIGYHAGYYENGSNKLYIDNTNTSEPLIYGEFNNNELTVNGDLTVDIPPSSIESRAEIKFAHEGTVEFTVDYDSTNDKFDIREGNTVIVAVSDFNVGIKRTPTTNDLEVAGTASKSSAGDWLANSDARLKKNIKALNSDQVLSKLQRLQGITYEWNDHRIGYNRPEGEQYGFTAQNIQEVFPELVSTDNEGYLQTSYGTYDAMYIEAIKALTNKIEGLEKRIQELEASRHSED